MNGNEQCLSEIHRTTSSQGIVTATLDLICRKPKEHHGPCVGQSKEGPVHWRIEPNKEPP